MPDGIIKRWGRPAAAALSALFGLLFLRFFGGRVLSAVLPFLFAFLVARLTLSPARFLARKTRVPLRVWAVLLTLLLFFSLGFGIFLLVRRLIVECGEILSGILSDPGLPSRIASAIESFSSFFLSRVPGGAGGPLLSGSDLAGMVRNGFSTLVSSFSRLLGSILSTVPSILFALFVSVVAAVWFASDPDGLPRLSEGILPPAWQKRVGSLGRGLFRGAGTVFYAYGILFCLTFLILFSGLLLLGVPYALLRALCIALFDLLPVLGAGGILVPWGIFAVVSGRAAFGACILFLSLLIFTVRQILAPRLIGRGLGIHPLLAFFAVYAGFKLAGAAGAAVGLFLSAFASRRIKRENPG